MSFTKVFNPLIQAGMYQASARTIATEISSNYFAAQANGNGYTTSGGTVIRPVFVAAQSAKPIIIVSSGTWADTTGSLTGLTALPYTPSGAVLVYIYAGSGVSAGLYNASFSSPTACQLYTSTSLSTKVSGTVAGAYAGGTTEASLVNVTIAGNLIGTSGALRVTRSVTNTLPTTANAKNISVYFGGTKINEIVAAFDTYEGELTVRNRDVANRQVNTVYGGSLGHLNSGSGQTNRYTSIDTTANQTVSIRGSVAVATDYLILEGYSVEVLPA
jgi:hypothetical protein